MDSSLEDEHSRALFIQLDIYLFENNLYVEYGTAPKQSGVLHLKVRNIEEMCLWGKCERHLLTVMSEVSNERSQ